MYRSLVRSSSAVDDYNYLNGHSLHHQCAAHKVTNLRMARVPLRRMEHTPETAYSVDNSACSSSRRQSQTKTEKRPQSRDGRTPEPQVVKQAETEVSEQPERNVEKQPEPEPKPVKVEQKPEEPKAAPPASSPAKPPKPVRVEELKKKEEPSTVTSPTLKPTNSTDSQGDESTVALVLAQTERLSDTQRNVIKSTLMELEKDSVRNGLQILLRMFSEHPRYKTIWPQFRPVPDSALISAPELRKHAAVYMGGLRKIMDAIDNNDQLSVVLKRIAKAHIKWNIHKHHVMHMAEQIVDLTQEKARSLFTPAEISDAWTALCDVISNLIEIFRKLESHKRR